MIRKGYYPTKGGYHVRIDRDIVRTGVGVVTELCISIAYTVHGEFAYKDAECEDDPGDRFDLVVEGWQLHPFDVPIEGGEEAHMDNDLSDAMKTVLQELSSGTNFLVNTTWYKMNWMTQDVAHQTIAALLRRGLIEKKTIEVYSLSDAGRQALIKQGENK